MKRLCEITKLVKNILEEKPETRDNDNLLWLEAVRETVRTFNYGNAMNELTFAYVLKNVYTLKLPSFETVSRARRKLQEKYPELRGSKKVRRKRIERETVYKEYARNG